eukprot:5102-Heterococcus_DN1.PRE.1
MMRCRASHLVLLLFLGIWTCHVHALYFLLDKASPRRCFLIDQPAETLVQIKAAFLDYAEGRTLDVTVTPSKREVTGTDSPPAQVPDRQGGLVDISPKSYELSGAEGNFPYEVPSSGEYTVCIAARGLPPSTPWRVSFETAIGQDEAYYKELAEKKGLNALQVQLQKLHSRVQAILNEADYMKEKETAAHKSSTLQFRKRVRYASSMTALAVMGHAHTVVAHLSRACRSTERSWQLTHSNAVVANHSDDYPAAGWHSAGALSEELLQEAQAHLMSAAAACCWQLHTTQLAS